MSTTPRSTGAQNPPPPIATPTPNGQSPGWYEDPWRQAAWRWFDGLQWTGHISGTAVIAQTQALTSPAATPVVAQPKKPLLPSFLSWPVALTALPSLGLLGLALFVAPVAVALGFVPLFIVMPVLLWIDRAEPEPRSAKVHTFLWGAFVAGMISVVINTVVALAVNETAAAVASAPIIEEITKALGIVWMVKRKEVDGPMDGIVYAGWAALGFAMVENISYFADALQQDMLIGTFVVRALLTPFAHPLFTMWTGLAIGLAVRSRKSPWTGIWGLFVAIALHAAWNGSLTLVERSEAGTVVFFAVLALFISLFFATIFGLKQLFKRDQKRHQELTPFLASRYNMSVDQVTLLLDRKALRDARAHTKDPASIKAMMTQASAMSRLAALFDHNDNPDSNDEARLYSQLVSATQK